MNIILHGAGAQRPSATAWLMLLPPAAARPGRRLIVPAAFVGALVSVPVAALGLRRAVRRWRHQRIATRRRARGNGRRARASIGIGEALITALVVGSVIAATAGPGLRRPPEVQPQDLEVRSSTSPEAMLEETPMAEQSRNRNQILSADLSRRRADPRRRSVSFYASSASPTGSSKVAEDEGFLTAAPAITASAGSPLSDYATAGVDDAAVVQVGCRRHPRRAASPC
ncbi:MAG: hypothetical protein WKF47_16330 [Geodermatophilaceae bacterium]